jgi:transcriptional regulator with XRE-family HTH domain
VKNHYLELSNFFIIKEGEITFERYTHMATRDVVAKRIYELCRERKWTPNHLAIVSAVPQATIKSILNGESQNPGIVTIKKLCDGFDISLSEFFTTPEFEELEQEIK